MKPSSSAPRRVGMAPGAALWRWLLALAMLAILVLSLLPPSPMLAGTGWDKSNHMLGFGTLALLGHLGWPRRTVMVLAALLAYGGLIEVLQSFTPDRSAEWLDLVADGVGLAVGHVLGRIAMFCFSRRSV